VRAISNKSFRVDVHSIDLFNIDPFLSRIYDGACGIGILISRRDLVKTARFRLVFTWTMAGLEVADVGGTGPSCPCEAADFVGKSPGIEVLLIEGPSKDVELDPA